MAPMPWTPADYDVLPYDAPAVPDGHPARLAACARLLGLRPAAIASARVLEIGCGTAASLVHMALDLPGASLVGVDLSPVQVRMGRDRARELGAANVELRVADATALPDDLGDFDFIIVRGVYSWVPERVADGVLASIRERLRHGGVAFVSANVMPGWGARGVARGILRRGARGAVGPAQRIEAGVRALATVAAQTEPGPYREQLMRELERIERSPPWLVLHDWMADVNRPVWFDDFVAHLATHQLSWLIDARFGRTLDSPRTLMGDYPTQVAAAAGLDLAQGTSLRAMLVVRADDRARVKPTPLASLHLCVTPAFSPTRAAELSEGVRVGFTDRHGQVHWEARALRKAALYALLDAQETLTGEQLARAAVARLSAAAPPLQAARDALAATLLVWFIAGLVELTDGPPSNRWSGWPR